MRYAYAVCVHVRSMLKITESQMLGFAGRKAQRDQASDSASSGQNKAFCSNYH